MAMGGRAASRVLATLSLVGALGAVTAVVCGSRAGVAAGWFDAGEDALRGQRFDEAVSYFAFLLSLDPGNAECENRLAEALDHSVMYVPAGEFIMGSDQGDVDEVPHRVVHLDAFEIDKYEVTNVQYRRFLRAVGSDGPRLWPGRYSHIVFDHPPDWEGDRFPPGEAMYPAAGIRWQDASEYCAWTGKRLPTEAEWEKAARGTDGRKYPWGDTWASGLAHVAGGERYARPVGSHASGASPYGAQDMAGNVWEWVTDLYDREYYSYAPERNPQGPISGTGERILRGGAWDSLPAQARASYRNATHFFGPNFRVGFRCARSAAERSPLGAAGGRPAMGDGVRVDS
jgi:formylglycine-generating enzyme required for sulfatase activity